MRVLIVEDQVSMVLVYRIALLDAGHELIVARDGSEAASVLKRESFDAVITDWMMPKQDGLALIRWIRSNVHPAPPIIMVTSLRLAEAVTKAVEAGADEYLVKPVVPEQILVVLDRVEKKQKQQVDTSAVLRCNSPSAKTPDFYAVAIAAGSGSGPVLERVLGAVHSTMQAAFLVVVHSPVWALDALMRGLSSGLHVPVELATEGQKIEPGKIVFAPGDRHMMVHPERLTIQLENSEPQNFVRPAADPLMRSVASAFGPRAVGLVLGGTGCDGAIGAGFIHTAGGKVLVLDPREAVVPQMSGHVIELGMADEVLRCEEIIKRIQELENQSLRAVK